MASSRERVNRLAAFEALGLMREPTNWSLTRAAEFVGLTRTQVLDEVGQAIYRQPNGRYRAKKWDRIPRFIQVPRPAGAQVIEIKDSRTASKVGALWNAIGQGLAGDPADLKAFGRLRFQSNGKTYEALTDLEQLKRLTLARELRFEDIYDLTQGGES